MKNPLYALLLLFPLTAAHADDTQTLTHQTSPGRKVLLAGYAESDANCRPRRVPSVVVVMAPAHGFVEQVPGEVVIGNDGVGGKACAGTLLPGVRVYYTPRLDFIGTERITLDVGYLGGRTMRAEVDVEVKPSRVR